jgi:hypothetical protein
MGITMSSRVPALQHALAEVLEIAPATVSRTAPFAEQGVDSLLGLRFVRGVQDLVGAEIDPEWLFDHPTIEQLSAFLDLQFGCAADAR